MSENGSQIFTTVPKMLKNVLQNNVQLQIVWPIIGLKCGVMEVFMFSRMFFDHDTKFSSFSASLFKQKVLHKEHSREGAGPIWTPQKGPHSQFATPPPIYLFSTDASERIAAFIWPKIFFLASPDGCPNIFWGFLLPYKLC